MAFQSLGKKKVQKLIFLYKIGITIHGLLTTFVPTFLLVVHIFFVTGIIVLSQENKYQY